MSTLAVVIVVIAILIIGLGGFVYYTLLSSRKYDKESYLKKFGRVQPLHYKLESGQELSESDVYKYAENLMTREMTFQLLKTRNLQILFPDEFYTIEMAAESNLANWLEYPTELGQSPDEMEYLKKVTIDGDREHHVVHYHVYKFRMHHPHWAAYDGWLLGVVGPYLIPVCHSSTLILRLAGCVKFIPVQPMMRQDGCTAIFHCSL
jgi:hypothetical protein